MTWYNNSMREIKLLDNKILFKGFKNIIQANLALWTNLPAGLSYLDPAYNLLNCKQDLIKCCDGSFIMYC
jgi:hypothetical protein